MKIHTRTPEEEKKRKRWWIFWLFLLLLLIIGLILGALIWSNHHKTPYDKKAINYNTHMARPKLKAGEGAFPGFGNFTVTQPGKTVAIALANPKYNDVDLKFTVTLTQTQPMTLIQTQLIAPGKAILKMRTPNQGRKGNYPLEIKIQAFKRSKHHEALNVVDQKIVMTVK